jgi:hypothetical protein
MIDVDDPEWVGGHLANMGKNGTIGVSPLPSWLQEAMRIC